MELKLILKTDMTDVKKFRILITVSTLLILFVVSYNILQEYFIPEIEGYLQRRLYYERVISKKGLSLHKGMYWREKE